MRKFLVVPVLLLAMSPFATFAQGPNYNYAEINYLSTNLDPGPTVDGFGLGASFAFADNFHVAVGFEQLSDSGIKLDATTIALGYNFGISTTTDFVARLGYAHARARITPFTFTEDGWLAQVGIRSMLTREFELNGFITHVDVGGSDTALNFGGVYNFTEQFGVTLGVGFSDDATSWTIGARFNF